MYTFHGWAEIVISDREDQDADINKRMDAALASVGKSIESFIDGSSIFEVRQSSNNLCVLLTHGLRNRANENAIDLFRWVGVHFPESHGLLYVRDDEDLSHENSYRVRRLARGKLEEFADKFLSPCVPVIEDAFNGA